MGGGDVRLWGVEVEWLLLRALLDLRTTDE